MPFIEHQGGYIHYREDGSGSPVVALHGSASTSKQWESLTGYIAGRFRVIRPDLPGYGKSSPITGRPSLSAIADALSALVREIGTPIHLVGHSFGGAVALALTHRMPGMIRSLAVIEPAAFHLFSRDQRDRAHLNELAPTVEAMRTASAEGDAGTAMARFIDFWNGDGAWARTSPELRQKLATCAGQVMDDFLAISGEAATFADYAAIACPVLAVTGRQSPVVTQALTERLARTIATARFDEILDAGHMAPLTDPHIIDPMIAAHALAAEQSGRAENGVYPMAA